MSARKRVVGLSRGWSKERLAKFRATMAAKKANGDADVAAQTVGYVSPMQNWKARDSHVKELRVILGRGSEFSVTLGGVALTVVVSEAK